MNFNQSVSQIERSVFGGLTGCERALFEFIASSSQRQTERRHSA